MYGDFPGGPVVSTTHYHCRGKGSIPGLGTKILHATCVEKNNVNCILFAEFEEDVEGRKSK